MFSFFKQVLMLILFFLCLGNLALYAIVTINQHLDFRSMVMQPDLTLLPLAIAAIALIAAPFVLMFLIAPLFQLKEERRWFAGLLRFVVFLLMMSYIGYQLVDARKVYHSFRESDLVIRDPNTGKAEFLLSSLLGGSLGPIPEVVPLSNHGYYQQVATYREAIESTWKRIGPYRVVVDQLADLTTIPHPADLEGTAPSTADTFLYIHDIAGIYLAKSCLEIALGNRTDALQHLSTILRVSRLGFIGAVDLNEKLAWAAVLEDGIRFSYWLITDASATYEEMKQLSDLLPRLEGEETALRLSWLAAYLTDIKRLSLPAGQSISQFRPVQPEIVPVLQAFPPQIRDVCYRMTFQKNRTEVWLKAFWEPVITSAADNTSAFRDTWRRQAVQLTIPPLNNLSGWYYHRPTDFLNGEKQIADLGIISDLFAALLQSHLAITGKVGEFLPAERKVTDVRARQIIDGGDDATLGTADDVVLTPLW